MDIEKAKKLYISQIEADQNTRFVRDVIKTAKVSKQNVYDTTAKLLKPTIDTQKIKKMCR